jgi:peptide/nickel transport system substrate-binding protein
MLMQLSYLFNALKESVAIQNALKLDSIEADGYTLHITIKQPIEYIK